jgi:hypothetical protein
MKTYRASLNAADGRLLAAYLTEQRGLYGDVRLVKSAVLLDGTRLSVVDDTTFRNMNTEELYTLHGAPAS